MTYQPGWSVISQTVVRRERWPGGYKGGSVARGVPLVYLGQEVLPDQPVLRMEQSTALPQDETVPAGMYGRVVDVTWRGGVVIEGRAAVIQGAFGVGNQVVGVLTVIQGQTMGRQLPAGAVLVVAGSLNFTMLRQAANAGVTGIVAGSIPIRDLEGFLRADLIQLVNRIDVEQAQAYLPAMTIMLTEGLGTASMMPSVLNVLSQHRGAIVLVSGLTSVRRGTFPELIISMSSEETQHNWHPVQPNLTLTLGVKVRVCGGEHEGAVGTVEYFFTYEQVFQSGVRSRAVRLRLEDGSFLVVPTVLIQRIG